MKYQFLKELKAKKNPILFLGSRILLKTNLSKLFLIRRNGYILRFNPTNLSSKMWIEKDYGLSEEIFFRKYLQKDDIVVDVGANIGSLSLTASKAVGKEGKVYAIEAHPTTFGYLLDNIKLNKVDNILPFNYALGSHKSEVLFSNRLADDMNCVSTDSEGVKVEVVPLDDLPIKGKISLLKVDVEGYEKFVLEGGNRVIENSELVYFEVIAKYCQRHGYQPKELVLYLKNHGFRIFIKSKAEVLSEIGEDSIPEATMLYAIRSVHDFKQKTGYKLEILS